MTAQVSDGFRYKDQDYSIAGVNGSGLFDPTEHAVKPFSISSACWRGFMCSYTVLENHLVLDHLSLMLRSPAPDLFGTKPNKPESKRPFWDAFYIIMVP